MLAFVQVFRYRSKMSEYPNKLAASIRRAIRRTGMTGYKLAQESGVSQATISRFMRNQIDLKLEVASRLCRVLGLELRGKDDG
jgi:ribosome-binding protein aMBF1 (putative translation factor)